MTRDEIVTALRCCAEKAGCNECPIGLDDPDCIEKMTRPAADLIENQQRHIEALMKANDSLKDAIARRDKQIEDMKQGMAQLAEGNVMNNNSNALGGLGGTLLQIAFIVLKLCGVINWSWLWVLSPMWIGFALWLLAVVIFSIVKAKEWRDDE